MEDGDYLTINGNKQTHSKLKFLGNLMQPFVDSYFIACCLVHTLMEKGLVIDQERLVSELHLGIQEIYHEGGIKHLSSCILDYVNTAFGRLVELQVCSSQAYETRDGQLNFLSCPATNRLVVERYLQTLSQLSSSDEQGFKTIQGEVAKVILRAQGPLARL